MKQLINESEAVGKVVEDIVIPDEDFASVVFTDGTILVLKSVVCYHGEYCEIEVAEELTSVYDKRSAGVITQEEYQEYLEERRRQQEVEMQLRAERNAAAERREYERLRAKFDK